MKLLTFQYKKIARLGHITERNRIIDLASASHGQLPDNMLEFLNRGEYNRLLAKKITANEDLATLSLNQVKLLAPVTNPPSVRDGYTFRQHVVARRDGWGLDMIPEYDEFPVFYFTNHHAITGPGDVSVMEQHLDKLDFEFEVAVVIGRRGRNISAKDADEYIAGYTIMNDWSARGIQAKEVKLTQGPSKSKDFATSMGPYMVIRDELQVFRIPGDHGERYDLPMTAVLNGEKVGEDNLKNMFWTFAQLIERASYGADLFPGDIIGSGACRTGCLLEANAGGDGPQQWLKPDDVVELTVDGLGTLRNRIVQNDH